MFTNSFRWSAKRETEVPAITKFPAVDEIEKRLYLKEIKFRGPFSSGNLFFAGQFR